MIAAIAGGAGCYSPSVVNGKLLCSTASTCPDGFTCIEDHCWRGGVVEVPDSGTDDDVAPPPDLACGMPLCTPSTPMTGVCDPTCQVGCECDEKCTINGAGVPACVKIKGVVPPLEPCHIENYGAPAQTDDCAAGSVCVRPDPNDLRAWCFALCASDEGCTNARCVARAIGPPSVGSPAAKVCDVPFTPCDPFATSNNGCPTTRLYCYLTSPDASGASRTVCEFLSGGRAQSEACVWSRDCLPTFVCPRADGDPTRRGVGFCTVPCSSPAHACGAAGACQPYGTTYGYCN